jgi:hypothetical protein
MAAAPSPLQEVAQAVEAAESFSSTATFDQGGGVKVTVLLTGRKQGRGWNGYLRASEESRGRSVLSQVEVAPGLGALVKKMVSLYPSAVLQPQSVVVKLAKGPTPGAKLTPVMVQAWCEAYGAPVPSLDDIAKVRKAEAAARKSADDGVLRSLAAGEAGVKALNKLSAAARARLSFKKAALSGLALDRAKFAGVNLEGADFSGSSLVRSAFAESQQTAKLTGAKFVGADLSNADLSFCSCTDSDFSDANLTQAKFSSATLRRTVFRGSNLSGALFPFTRLLGVDFTGAELKDVLFRGTPFDEKTRWPKGYKLPEGLVWAGEGADPRLAASKAERSRPKPTDFAGFLRRLERATDKAKLDKALAMLKADRFRLFARVDGDQVVGVVKSQSDPTLVYSCRLGADGKYACCTQNLNVCGGLRGSPCKHLLVLVLGLTHAGDLDPATAHDWTLSSRGQKPALDKDAMTETLLRYKGAEAGEVDWRPTETIPEDFYAM